MTKPLYGLIGKKLGHSFSQKHFTQKFQREQIHARYELFELEHAELFLELFEKYPELVGINVTIPFKQDVIPFLHRMTPEAEAVGAVNTIRRDQEGFSGFNSDIYGFRDSLANFLGDHTVHKALILGTGGSSKAVIYALEHFMNICEWISVSRNPRGTRQIGYTDLQQEDMNSYTLIINTTPLGMYPHVEAAPDLPYDQLGPDHFVYDLIYNPEETLLLKRAREQGAKTLHGLPMLIGQAEKSWAYWNHLLD